MVISRYSWLLGSGGSRALSFYFLGEKRFYMMSTCSVQQVSVLFAKAVVSEERKESVPGGFVPTFCVQVSHEVCRLLYSSEMHLWDCKERRQRPGETRGVTQFLPRAVAVPEKTLAFPPQRRRDGVSDTQKGKPTSLGVGRRCQALRCLITSSVSSLPGGFSEFPSSK